MGLKVFLPQHDSKKCRIYVYSAVSKNQRSKRILFFLKRTSMNSKSQPLLCLTIVLLRFFACTTTVAQNDQENQSSEILSLTVSVAQDEQWWFGVTSEGDLMPLTQGYSQTMIANNHGNQIQPLLISNKGRGVWSDSGFSLAMVGDELRISGGGS